MCPSRFAIFVVVLGLQPNSWRDTIPVLCGTAGEVCSRYPISMPKAQEDARVLRMRHACSTLDELCEETRLLYTGIEAKARRLKTRRAKRRLLKPARNNR